MQAYAEACHGLERAGLRYLVIGAIGVDLYAHEIGVVITTGDCDILIPATTESLAAALAVMRDLGYEFEAGGEPLVDPGDEVILRGIVRARAAVRARRSDILIDVALDVAAIEFESAWERHRVLAADGGTVRVAPLADLIRSKQVADRPKDRLFLEMYREVVERAMRWEEKHGREPD